MRPSSLLAPLLLTLACATPTTTSDPAPEPRTSGRDRPDASEPRSDEPPAPQSPDAPAEPEASDAAEPEASDAPAEPEASDVPATPVTEAQVKAAASSVNAFSVDVYRLVAEGEGNRVVSPASIAIALGMTVPGGRGETLSELRAALHLGEEGDVAGLGGLLRDWNGRRPPVHAGTPVDFELQLANRLFGSRDVRFHDAYSKATAALFGAPLEPVDFAGDAEGARARINKWVEAQTRDKIRDLVPPGGITSDTRLMLVNAVYFKAQWMDPFSESRTKPETFWADGTRGVEAPMMHREGHYAYAETDGGNVQVVQIPYDAGGFALTIVLPRSRQGLAAVEKALSTASLDAWLAAHEHKKLALALPRFRIDPPAPLVLSPLLRRLGLERALDPQRADFSGIAPAEEQLFISEGFHKAFIAVDEKGTEAAAATALGMRAGAAPRVEEPIPVVADHPFLYILHDRVTGAILFIGRVVDPRAAG